MNTPTHLLFGLAAFGRRAERRIVGAAAIGALLPDLSLYLLAGTSIFLLGIPPQRVFDELYFSSAWQTIFAIDNSFVLWAAFLGFALWRGWAPAVAMAAAGLLHLALDFPLHHDDARRHFFPMTDWVWESPLSYWDSAHHAGIVAPLGAAGAVAAGVMLWRYHASWRMRGLTLALVGAELWVLRQWLVFF
jgi:membrane-bound metal-dependent hydrolase YbcI (DUF457 family)